ncbi:MAG: hypothetical protein ACHQQ3_01075 [Gemmatimonadales bacterium]
MNFALLIARLLHIVPGVFWAGTMIFNATFLGPSLRDAGPNAGPVMANLINRRMLDIIPVAAALNLLSGFWLYWHASLGFSAAYMSSGPGMTYGAGLILALTAFGVGMLIVRPSMLGAFARGKAMQTAVDADKQRLMAEIQALRMRAGKAGQAVAWLLGTTVVAMAISRYL